MAKKTEKLIEEKLKTLYGNKAMLDDDLNRLEKQYNTGLTNLDNERLEELSNKIQLKKYEIKNLQEEIDQVRDDKEELEKAEEESRNYKWKEIVPDILKVIEEQHMSYNVETNKFIYCMDMGEKGKIKNPVFRTFDATRVERVIGKALNRWLFDANIDIVKLFMTKNKTHYQETASFLTSKWSQDKVYNKAHIIRNSWLEPLFEEPYHKDFDILMYCVGGGKQENIDHLEQWIAYKYLWPERSANTPNLDLGGNPGGNGKTIYAELCKTIFTPTCVVPAVAKELMDGFNATWELAIILHFDEPEEKELPASKMKNATGGVEQRVERKGVDAYSADRNYNIIATSNNILGVFKLAGTGSSGEDRRYSVINTNIPLVDEIMIRENCDEETAKIRANQIAHLIRNQEEVARWLGAMILKHDIYNLLVLKALHGQDYHDRFQDQKSGLDDALDSLMPIAIKQGCVSIKHVGDLLAAKLNHKTKPSSRVVIKWLSTWLTRHKISYTKLDRQRITITWKGTKVDNREHTIFEFVPNSRIFEWNTVCNKNYTSANLILEADDILF